METIFVFSLQAAADVDLRQNLKLLNARTKKRINVKIIIINTTV